LAPHAGRLAAGVMADLRHRRAPATVRGRVYRHGQHAIVWIIANRPCADSRECESAWPKTHRRRAMRTQRAGSYAIHRQLENAYAGGSTLDADVGQCSRPIYSTRDLLLSARQAPA
jgi:hypothetical protein